MPEENTNLDKLTASRKAQRVGDVFALRVDGRYFFGRVISTEAVAGPSMRHAILAYLFEAPASTIDGYDAETLRPDRLLVPPFMINKLPWSRGYFQTVAHLPLEAGQRLEQHCFRAANGTIYDEALNVLPQAQEPCGIWGLASYRSVDDQVSARLGLPLAAD